MKIKLLGHATFLITSNTGVRIVTDPYTAGEGLCFGEIEEAADIVTVSHGHFDHSNVAAVRGNPEVVRGNSEVKGVRIKGIPSYHDASHGHERGDNTIFCFEIDGMTLCHLGDLGHLLSDGQVAEIGNVDVLLIPVGGFYTIDATTATEVCDQIKPRVVIPMHYRDDKCTVPIGGVDEFLRDKQAVSRLTTSEVEFKTGELPTMRRIVVLTSAR